MASLLPQLFLDSGAGLTPSDGAKLFFRIVGSGTLKNTFPTAAATVGTENANPVVANGVGVFPPIYITGDYDWVLQGKNSVQQNSGSVSEFVTSTELTADLLLSSVKPFPTLADAVADTGLVDGDALSIAERTTGSGGGAMWDVVLSTTVTEDTFSIVQATGVGTLSLVLRIDGDLHIPQFGDLDTVSNRRATIQAAIDATPVEGTLDGDGVSYTIDLALTINKRMDLKNVLIRQTIETEDVLVVEGPLATGPKLFDVNLSHDFFTINTGSLLVLSPNPPGTIGFFEWKGSKGICNGGYHAVRGRGNTFETKLEMLWFNDLYSSGVYMPAQGDVVDDQSLGGATTLTLKHVFVSDIQTSDPAFAIGTGYDTVSLDTCSADHVSNFAFIKASPFSMKNCSSENIRNPLVGTLTGTHKLIDIRSGFGHVVDGFAFFVSGGFVPPTPTVGTVNAIISSSFSNNLRVEGVSGNPVAGYYTLDQEGGKSFVNTSLVAGPLRGASGGAIIDTPEGIFAQNDTVQDFDRISTNGDLITFSRDSLVVGAVEADSDTNTSIILKAETNIASVKFRSKDSGGVAGDLLWNWNVTALYPNDDDIADIGRAGFRWDDIWATNNVIQTSDERYKQFEDITEVERTVALEIKSGIRKFKWLSSIEEKGEDESRWHIGVGAQTIKAIFESHGLDAFDYALLCYDEWGDEFEPIKDEGGKVTGQKKVKEAGNRYAVRYTELLAFIISVL